MMSAEPQAEPLDLAALVRATVEERDELREENARLKAELESVRRILSGETPPTSSSPTPHLKLVTSKPPAPSKNAKPPTRGKYFDVLSVMATDEEHWWTSKEVARLLDWPSHQATFYKVAAHLKRGRDLDDIEYRRDGHKHFYMLNVQGVERLREFHERKAERITVNGYRSLRRHILDEVWEVLIDEGWSTVREVSASIGRNEGDVRNALKHLVEIGKAVVGDASKGGRGAPARTYAIKGTPTPKMAHEQSLLKPTGPIDAEALDLLEYLSKVPQTTTEIARKAGEDADLVFAWLAHLELHGRAACTRGLWVCIKSI